jgi:hypothetical protein
VQKLRIKVLVQGRGIEQPLAIELRKLLEDGSLLGIAIQG